MNENKQNFLGNTLFSLKNVLRLLALLCIIFVFCPSFLVSCSGSDMKISAMTAVTGVKSYGQTIVKPNIIMLIVLLIPIGIEVLLFINKLAEKITAIVIMALSFVNIIVWTIFRMTTKKLAEENFCDFKTLFFYYINMLVIISIIVLSLLVVIGKMHLAADLKGCVPNNIDLKNVVPNNMNLKNFVPNHTTNPKSFPAGCCQQCGTPIEPGYKFCKQCGSAIPVEPVVEPVAEPVVEPVAEPVVEPVAEPVVEPVAEPAVEPTTNQFIFCHQCGAKMPAGSAFCQMCGTKLLS